MSKGKTRQYNRRVVRKELNRSSDPNRVVHGYGGVMKTAAPKPLFNVDADDAS